MKKSITIAVSVGIVFCMNVILAQDPGSTPIDELKKNADKGNAEAQFRLGGSYLNKKGAATDPAEAVKWYRKAADQGYAPAQCELGFCHARGLGLNKDPAEAVKWYRKAADQKHAMAQYKLARCYENGRGTEKNYAEAMKWYRKAAEQGYAPAQCELGLYSAVGMGIRQDYAEALKWLRKAADQKHAAQSTRNMALALYKKYEQEHVRCQQKLQAEKIQREQAQRRKRLKAAGKCPDCEGSGWVRLPGLLIHKRCSCRIIGRSLTTGEIFVRDDDGRIVREFPR